MLPFIIGRINPITKNIIYYFLIGILPKNVYSNVVRYIKTGECDKKIMHEYYGDNWINLFTRFDPYDNDSDNNNNELKTNRSRKQDGLFKDFIIGGSEEDEELPFAISTSNEVSKNEYTIEGKKEEISSLCVTDEDTFMDIRYKAQLVAGIPMGRQHIFYYYSDEGPNVPYKITVAGTPIIVNFNYIKEFQPSMEFDLELERNKELISISCFDHVMTVREHFMHISYVFVIDMFDVINPHSDGLSNMLHDDYQFDLLYYGYIIKYWPQLSANVANMLLTGTPDLSRKFPLLFPLDKDLMQQYSLESKIVQEVEKYNFSPADLSIKSAIIIIIPKTINTKVLLRNVYDKISISNQILAMVLNCDIDPLSIIQLDLSIMQNIKYGTFPLYASKRHITSYQPKYLSNINNFIHEKIMPNTIRIACQLPGSSYILKIIIYLDGHIELISQWSEYEHIDFNKIQEDIVAVGMKIINKIQKMGNSAFTSGNIDQFKIEIGKITVINTWKHALTNTNYKEMLKRLKIYEEAGLINFRNLQHKDMTVLMFKKGIVKGYNPRYDRINSGNNNSYIRLSDSIILQRFNTTFSGRMVKIHHRVSDIQIEIVDASSPSEYKLIFSYIFSFLDGLLTGPDKIQIEKIVNVSQDKKNTTQGSKRLKQLQERDPILFNLKRYDQNYIVYSVLCQSGRQPHTYTEEELKFLPHYQKNRAIKYWNFTENKPLWYLCQNSKYPYLSLRSGVHPLGYCLPCCKTTSLPDKTFEQCMQIVNDIKTKGTVKTEDITFEEASNPMSRHVLTWGKEIADGRVSQLSPLLEQLFIGAIKPPFEIKAIGVNQSTLSVPNAGFAIALGHAIAEDGQTAEQALEDIAKYAANMGRTYYAIGGVAGLAFNSAQSLAEGIRQAFIKKEDVLTPFSPGGMLNEIYPNVLIELVRLAFGHECIIFRESADGEISIEISAEAKINIMTNPDVTIYMIIISQMGTYPLSAIDHKFYLRVEYELRWEVERKIFTNDDGGDKNFIRDEVVDIIRNIIRTQKTPILFDVGTAENMIKNTEYKLVKRLSNNQNKCYGLLITSNSDKTPFYIPVNESEYPIDEIPVLFGVRPIDSTPSYETINKFMNKFKIIDTISVIDSSQKDQVALFDNIHKLVWYHKKQPYVADKNSSFMILPYDTREIDMEITKYFVSNNSDDDNKINDFERLASVGRWKNNLYKLYLAEFASIINNERNITLRQKIKKLISSTKFDVIESIQKFRTELFNLLDEHPDDILLMRKIIQTTYKKSNDPGEDMISIIESTVFNFDRLLLIELYKLSFEESVQKIKTIMMERCIIDDHDQIFNDNIYSGCSMTDSSYCENSKLKIPQKDYNLYAELLTQAIKDNNQRHLLPVLHSGIFNYFQFRE